MILNIQYILIERKAELERPSGLRSALAVGQLINRTVPFYFVMMQRPRSFVFRQKTSGDTN
ncbi:MAG: hypothetical protein WA124_09690, partial [Smithella sp.]